MILLHLLFTVIFSLRYLGNITFTDHIHCILPSLLNDIKRFVIDAWLSTLKIHKEGILKTVSSPSSTNCVIVWQKILQHLPNTDKLICKTHRLSRQKVHDCLHIEHYQHNGWIQNNPNITSLQIGSITHLIDKKANFTCSMKRLVLSKKLAMCGWKRLIGQTSMKNVEEDETISCLSRV